jgi:hypothetical protein
MANIREIASRHNVKLALVYQPSPSPVITNKPQGRIRRAWLPDADTLLDEINTMPISETSNKFLPEIEYLGVQKNPSANIIEMDHKRITNGSQIGHRTVHKRSTNGTQNGTQTEHKQHTETQNNTQTDHKQDTERYTERHTNGSQKRDKIIREKTLANLSGLQRQIILAMYSNCCLNGEKITQQMTINHLATLSSCNQNSIKTTIFRLKEKKYIAVVDSKDGRGGWAKYEINNDLYVDILRQEESVLLSKNRTQTDHKQYTERYTERYTNPLSSSSINIYKNTTTTSDILKNEKPSGLSDAWLNLDIEPLSMYGFTQTHIQQLASSGKIEPDIVQESIFAFAFDLTHNDKAKVIKTSPISFFMGILRNGKPYTPSGKIPYESPQDEAMRLYLEKQITVSAKRKKRQEELFKLNFEEWRDNLTEEEVSDITRGLKFEGHKSAHILEHYKKNMWPEVKLEIMQNNQEFKKLME